MVTQYFGRIVVTEPGLAWKLTADPSLSVRADTQRLLQRLVIFALWLDGDASQLQAIVCDFYALTRRPLH